MPSLRAVYLNGNILVSWSASRLEPLFTSCLGAFAVTASYFSPQLTRSVRTRWLRDQCRRERTLVLTYDDGPGCDLTPRLLDLLGSHGAKATFFLLGRRAAVRPHIVDQVAIAGHELGCHGHKHINAWKSLPWRAARDILAGYRVLDRWIPARALFRPPFGKLTMPTALLLRWLGISVGWWTVDSGDTHAIVPDSRSVVDAACHDGGGVVLLHDFDRRRPTRVARSRFVLETTDRLLKAAQTEGLRVTTLGKLLNGSAVAEAAAGTAPERLAHSL